MTDLTKLQELAAALPKELSEKALALVERMGASIEGLGDEPQKWRPGNLKLIQGTSDRSKLPKGAIIGSLVLGDVIYDTPFNVIPMSVWSGRQMWSPDQNEAKLLCSSPDGKVGYMGYDCKTNCPHSKFDEVARKSECGATYVVLAIAADMSDIFAITFAKTNYAIGKGWFKDMKDAGVAVYRRVYGLRSETNKQYKQVESFVVEKYSGKDKETPAAVLPFIEELFKMIRDDRQEMLTSFHKMIIEKRASQANAPTLIESSANDIIGEVTLIEAPTEVAGTSEMAAKYKV